MTKHLPKPAALVSLFALAVFTAPFLGSGLCI